MGEAAPRTVVSGLVKFIPEAGKLLSRALGGGAAGPVLRG